MIPTVSSSSTGLSPRLSSSPDMAQPQAELSPKGCRTDRAAGWAPPGWWDVGAGRFGEVHCFHLGHLLTFLDPTVGSSSSLWSAHPIRQTLGCGWGKPRWTNQLQHGPEAARCPGHWQRTIPSALWQHLGCARGLCSPQLGELHSFILKQNLKLQKSKPPSRSSPWAVCLCHWHWRRCLAPQASLHC